MDLQHNIQVDKIKMEIWTDRQNFLTQIIEIENKNSEDKNDKSNIQDDEDNMKDSNKIVKNKKIHAKSIKQLEGIDHMDRHQDGDLGDEDIMDIRSKGNRGDEEVTR